MGAKPPRLIAGDLAAGDVAAREFDWSHFRITRVRTADDPLFSPAYRRLSEEFGPRGEMEQEAVIRARLDWSPAHPVGGHGLLYEILVVEREGTIVALRDHTAIVPADGATREVIVHLSHVWIEPAWRGTGLSGWLRALPIQTAMEAATTAVVVTPSPAVTLVAEMEHPDPVAPAVLARLRSYERAGFLKIDPRRVAYAQPDFRPADQIDSSAIQPLPLALVVRRVGREHERAVAPAEVRRIVNALYSMFAVTTPARHMEPLWTWLDGLFPTTSSSHDRPVELLRPSA